MGTEFKAPKGWEAYSNSVVDKTRILIGLGIWEGISELDLNRWLQNFNGDAEKYFGACMLDALTYRSKKMCFSMMRNILMDLVPNFCRNKQVANFSNLAEWKAGLSSGDRLVRFVPVNISDGKIKSATLVARYFIEANDLPQRFIQQPDTISRAVDAGTKVIVFLDDFAGSGFQFLKFLKQNSLDHPVVDACFLYAPLCAHRDAISRIEAAASHVRVIPIDTLTDKDSFFYDAGDGFFRGDGQNSIEMAKQFYSKMFDRSAKRKYLFGMSGQSLTYSFFMSTPNNNLKALYHNESDVWKRLVFRGQN